MKSLISRLTAPILAGLSALLLSACLHLGEPKAVGPRPDRNTITAFSLEGRLSVRQADRSYQAGVQWTHGVGQENILLTGPLGQGLATLESS
ncbi:MAG TPA: lipoprotein insertase outer membrane protein LolB, partial [Rhodocyclaceae bacterium]|nr:lipoprotein insertase outer membrane protein LolB [Rhodocyclaceae bacterium]